MPKNHSKLTKAQVKRAISKCLPRWADLALACDCHHLTIKAFMWQEKNKDLLDLFNEKLLNVNDLADTIWIDAISDGDLSAAIKWKNYQMKQKEYDLKVKQHEEGSKISVDGDVSLSIIIKKDDEEELNKLLNEDN